jgi:predicted RNase H-like nuclease
MEQQPVDRATVSTWLRTFDEGADELHVDITPSVLALIDHGLAGAEAVLDRLNAPDRLTRKRAQRVMDGAIAKHFGWVSGTGYPTPDAEHRAQAVMAANGYDADAPESERVAAIARWRQWLAAESARGKERA